jgi:hypothetical protein
VHVWDYETEISRALTDARAMFGNENAQKVRDFNLR